MYRYTWKSLKSKLFLDPYSTASKRHLAIKTHMRILVKMCLLSLLIA